MTTTDNKKWIKIPYNGPIYAKSGVIGPIMSPYREDINVIIQMLKDQVPVFEVVDGREILLTLINIYRENTTETVTVKNDDIEVPVPSDFETDTENPETPESTETEVDNTEEQTKPQNQNQQKQHNHNQKNQHRQQPKVDNGTQK